MSTNICSYQDCMVRRLPFSSIAFFGLPNDKQRRAEWIINSGNKELLQLKTKQVRFFCENHFDKSDVRVQFNRKMLHRHAVLKPHKSVTADVEKTKLMDMLKTAMESTATEEHDLELEYSDVENAKQKTMLETTMESTVPVENDKNLELECIDNFEAEHNGSSEAEHEIHRAEVVETLQIDDDIDPETEDDCDLVDLLLESNAEDEMNSSNEIEYIETESKANDSHKLIVTSNTKHIINTPDNTVFDVEDESLEDSHKESTFQKDGISMDNMSCCPNTIPAATNTITAKAMTTATADYESDKYFALSLVNYFQKLEPQTKALAKIKILSYLTALEFGKNIELM